jgi:hypothetical protein
MLCEVRLVISARPHLSFFTVVDLFSHPPTRVRMGREVSGAFTALKWLGSLLAEVPRVPNTCGPFNIR